MPPARLFQNCPKLAFKKRELWHLLLPLKSDCIRQVGTLTDQVFNKKKMASSTSCKLALSVILMIKRCETASYI